MYRVCDKRTLLIDQYLTKFSSDEILLIDGDDPENTSDLGSEKAVIIQNLQIDALYKEINEVLLRLKDSSFAIKITHSRLSTFPECIAKLIGLEAIGIFLSDVDSVPDDIQQLQHLSCFQITNGKMRQFPTAILKCSRLTHLDFSSQQMTELPENIGVLKHLKVLKVYYNQLRGLPDSLGQLTKLSKLIVCNNEIESLPADLKGLESLQAFDFAFNKVINIPDFLAHLPALTEVYLYKNPISNLPEEMCVRDFVGSASVFRRYLEDGLILNDNSLGEFDHVQLARVVRGARALMTRGIYYLAIKKTNQAEEELNDAFHLSTQLKDHKTAISSAIFLDFLAMSTGGVDFETYLESTKWQDQIDDGDFNEFSTYRDLCQIRMLKFGFWIPFYEPATSKHHKEDFLFYLNVLHNQDYSEVAISPEDPFLGSEVNAQQNFRDYLRGLIWIGKWEKTMLEYSSAHYADLKQEGTYEEVVCPIPNKPKEVGLRFLHLTNNDKLGVAIRFFGEEKPLFLLLDANAIFLNRNQMILMKMNDEHWKALSESMQEIEQIIKRPSQETIDYFEEMKFQGHSYWHTSIDFDAPYEALWDLVFGSKVLKIFDGEQEDISHSFRGYTLHQILQKKQISNLLAIPSGTFNSLNLNAAFNKNEKKYAVEYYHTTYLPMWRRKDSNHQHHKLNCAFVLADLSEEAGLSFAGVESKVIGDQFSSQGTTVHQFNGKTKAEILEALPQYQTIHIAAHGNNSLSFYSKEGQINLLPEELS